MNVIRRAISLCSVRFNKYPQITAKKSISVNACNKNLMEFFDEKKHWGESSVRVGRAWRLDELRIKSNTDLHKLWYVLLKERNMLFTMEHECNDKLKIFPCPERIDKVEESMKNIESVVRERNTAYYQLETGEIGERPVEDVVNLFGLPERYEKKEYSVPKFMNTKWIRLFFDNGYISSIGVKKFYRLFREKEHNEKRKAKNRDFNHVQQLLKRFPDMDLENLKMAYPEVDIEKAQRTKKARGHCIPKY